MKHLVVGAVMMVLITISLVIGIIWFLYEFQPRDFVRGTRFINTYVIKGYVDWMPWS
jgi:hypothetical protein